MGSNTLLEVVEAAYDVDVDEEQWLSQILHRAAPALDRGLGLWAWTIKPGPSGCRPRRPEVVVGLSVAPSSERFVSDLHRFHPDALRRIYRDARTVSALVETEGPGFQTRSPFDWPRGVVDFTIIKSVDPEVGTLVIGVPSTSSTPTASATELRWSRIMAHLTSGRRLRRRMRETRRHSRETLRETARRIDRAQHLRTVHPEGFSLWAGIVSGEWSLVDRFESEGRRFLVAMRNGARMRDPRALTEREREVATLAALGRANKEIAYELEMSMSTVATHLRHVRRKLHVSTRVGLIRAMACHD